LIGTISVKTFENFGTLGNSFLQFFSFFSEFCKSVSHKNELALPYLQMMKTCVNTEAIVTIFARILYDFIDTTVDVQV
jgi:hypothetical protein